MEIAKAPTMIVEIKLLDSGKLKGFADLTLPTPFGEVTIKGFRIIQGDDGQFWVAHPATSYMKDGKQVNNPILEVSRSLKKQISEAIISEFERVQERP